MANNKWTIVIFACLLTVVFFAGGWFFSRASQRAVNQEVEGLYQSDGTSVGIFDGASTEELAAAQNIAAEALADQAQQVYPLQARAADGSAVRWDDIVSFVPKESEVVAQERAYQEVPAARPHPEIHLQGNETAPASVEPVRAADDEAAQSQIVMVTAPIRFSVIRNLDEYKAFKTRARGSYPVVDFNKQMVVVLESDSNFPDNIFEAVSAKKQDGALVVSYRVNMLGFNRKINSHSVLPVDKTQLPIELKQVL